MGGSTFIFAIYKKNDLLLKVVYGLSHRFYRTKKSLQFLRYCYSKLVIVNTFTWEVKLQNTDFHLNSFNFLILEDIELTFYRYLLWHICKAFMRSHFLIRSLNQIFRFFGQIQGNFLKITKIAGQVGNLFDIKSIKFFHGQLCFSIKKVF